MNKLIVRHLLTDDIDALMTLERSKWTDEQRATAQSLRARIDAHPKLCIGAFCAETGRALASLFLKPTTEAAYRVATTWEQCAQIDPVTSGDPSTSYKALFGISLSSVDGEATDATFRYFVPWMLKFGVTQIFLGSPVPGFRKARERSPRLTLQDYVLRKRRDNTPADPQLKYYFHKGFTKIVSAQEHYFPHDKALDCAAIVMFDGRPLRPLLAVTRHLPLSWLHRLSSVVFTLIALRERQLARKGRRTRATGEPAAVGEAIESEQDLLVS